MADKKKRRIPKTIAGVKIPKDVRRQGEALIDTVVASAQSPAGREMIAGALTMAATAATAAMAKGRASHAAAAPPPPRAPEPPVPPESVTPPRPPFPPKPPQGATREPDWQAFADTVSRNAEQALGRLFGGKG